MLLRRRLSLIAIGALAVGGMLSGCAPSPAPTPTPTPAFASDEEAFAAAEEVYRAYIAALNARAAGRSIPNPRNYLIGRALESDIDGQEYLDGNGLSLQGTVAVTDLILGHVEHMTTGVQVSATACIDLSESETLDQDGDIVTPIDRPSVIAQAVRFVYVDTSFLITEETEAEATSCAS
ncbi:hypothetical protein [Microbacterium sp. NPDC089696]|uniref:hypothetical protein n=1 Tax=Microbacterium sp. NPDC089696 TaxID=3364199 RepID=UPI0038235CC1